MTMIKLSHLLPLLSSSSHRHHLLARILRFSTAAATEAQNPTPKPPSFFLQYLIDSVGLSPERAAIASKHIAHFKSLSNPDSVLHFLRDSGLDDAQIRDVLSKRPSLLRSKVEPTLKPKLRALLELGFSESELSRLIHLCPETLAFRDMKPKIEFWRAFYPTNEGLFKAMKRDSYLLNTNIERIMPNISLLRSCSLSNDQIAKLIPKAPRIITKRPHSMQALIRRAEELGVGPGSRMFYYALCAVNSSTDANIKAKTSLLESYGCPKSVVMSGIQRFPSLVTISEKLIADKMDFLIKTAGCEPSYVLLRAPLLGYSLERRLIPRHRVRQILKSMDLAGGDNDLYNAIHITDEKFIDKFVLPHKEKVPELLGTYLAACAGKLPSSPGGMNEEEK